jgi:PHP family Zn ribbon phosphoesterase
MPKVHNANSTTPSRVGKRGTTIYFDVATHRALKELSLEHDKSITALLNEGVNLMLGKYGRKPIA